MHALSELMAAVSTGDRQLAERQAAALRRLDERLHAEEEAADDYRRSSLRPHSRTRAGAAEPRR